ncbi:TIGR04255 family protein [Cronobacter sakazakii]|uniref:TIGR04255 family protein n=2 Tax=Cronobacter sakazakii TaxID=28141 RepID=UPI002893BDA0|nr:TIGR04255 family protein [Cronobacter sakazakii]EJV9471546.1 TIGR04255 family protein [Cronobacter sakazakii]ELY3761897.1 TIGR04255 family protein [Cronobacter universalis]MDT3520954.1 TIGR04255 family protein [Cronobacter sakazakii]
MSGRYKKAPLSYVVGRITTSALADLKSEQMADLQQSLTMLGFINKEISTVHEFDFATFNPNIDSSTHFNQVKRTAFLNIDRKKIVIFDSDSIELRTTSYIKYDHFMEEFDAVLKAFISSVPAYGKAAINEAILAYVDVIVPVEQHSLSDFFKDDENALPMTSFGDRNNIFAVAKTELNEIIDATHRVYISLEQLPQRMRRFVPEAMIEPEVKFAMPISITHEPQKDSRDPYVILTTQAAQLHSGKILEEMSAQQLFSDSHLNCGNAFKGIINRDVCDIVWEYTEE